ncbi:hypothetical protein OS493_005804 [Desmophyllum pertusum]|uniref:Death domain-containing protein n=1 Tax=Desmophyllum pertusum TaxID=174260 RepID=A0A9W9YIN9_9CNID|nr:hypothetical protein OS493_005804 [Desmophyllum pertusum]
MASSSADSSIQSNAVLGIGRLVEETSGHETFKHLGPTCLAKFESTQFLDSMGTPNSNYFLVASNQVLTKDHLKALEKQEREKRNKKRESSVKIVAEFPRIKDQRKLERKPLSELYSSLEEDVFELNGIIYVALTKLTLGSWHFGKSSLINRALEAIDTENGNGSSVLTSDQLQGLVFCGERTASTRGNRNVCELSTRVYDLLQFDSFLANDESRPPSYFLRNDENKRFFEEREFAKDEKPLGAIILNKDRKLAGVLNFINKHPSPVIVGSALETDPCSNTRSSLYGAGASKDGEMHNETERDMLVGASGRVYPLLDPQAKSEIGTEAAYKADILPQPATTASTGNPFVAGLNMTDGHKGADKSADHGATTQPQVPIVNGEKKLQEKNDQDFAKETPSPTENSYRSCNLNTCNQTDLDVKGVVLVNLPPENSVKEVPPVAGPAGELGGHQTNTQGAHGSTIVPQDRSRDNSPHSPGGGRRHSFPPCPPPKEEHPPATRSSSSASKIRPAEKKTKFQLSDPLTKTILGFLELLEALGRCLDKEYKYGQCKCWKHIAEFFRIPEQKYENFKCNKVHSPTEVMFEYLESDRPDITVGDLKNGLHQIERQDVIGILIKHENCDQSTLNDNTLVCSLFDSDPDIIGEMAFMLDKQKFGLKNWSHLAAELGISRTTFKSFETSSTDNPTKKLFEVLAVHFPGLTVKELISHLEAMHRRDVIIAIKKSKKVTELSLIKELMADLDVMDNVCELLNKKKRTTKVLGLEHLGNRLGVKKEILDDLLPTEEETQSPTEALLRHLGGWKPWLTLSEFIWALHTINRPDVLTVLDVFLPDGCIPILLLSCNCERCQQSKESLLQQRGEDQ